VRILSEILVEVVRGNRIECIHRGSIVVVNARGDSIAHVGNPDTEISMRSCAKPIQAIPVIETGAARRFGFTDKELALFCGSVSGQDCHVAAVRSVLQKIGLSEEALLCGVHAPSHRQTAQDLQQKGIKAGPVHNNCAGKHAAMLALCVHHGWSTENYLPLEHPVQQLILSKIIAMTGVQKDFIYPAVDGCGVPVFFIPLKSLARAYARFAEPYFMKEGEWDTSQKAIRQLMNAVCTYPEMVAGDERICTDIMRTAEKTVFAKTGAEGGYALTIFEKVLGIAVKIEDGNPRAIGPVVIEILNQLGILTQTQKDALKSYHQPSTLNHRKEQVGELRAIFKL
jgi:L-asparaginase II